MFGTWAEGGRGGVGVLRVAALSRGVTIATLVLSQIAFCDHDATGVQRFSEPVSTLLSAFTRWDSAWFLTIARRGYPSSLPMPSPLSAVAYAEQAHAFFPLLPWLVRSLASLLSAPSVPSANMLVIAGVVINSLSFMFAALGLYRLSIVVLGKERDAWWAAVAFCWNPAGIFFSTIYTESLFSALTFVGLSLLASSPRNCRFKVGWLVAVLFAFATLCRSNGLLNGWLFGIHKACWILADLWFLMRRRPSHHCHLWRFSLRLVGGVVNTALQGLLIASPFIWFQLHCYHKFCHSQSSHAWCYEPGVLLLGFKPSLYAWVQHTYWGVGPFRYYQLRQVPNFLLAAPMVTTSVWAQWRFWYAKTSSSDLFKVILRPILAPSQESRGWEGIKSVPYMLHWLFLLCFSLVSVNVQVTTRLLAASCPPVHWVMGSMLSGKHGIATRKAAFTWIFAYTLVGAAMHSNFLPWT
jgi:phosphatidylinositol glycan class V